MKEALIVLTNSENEAQESLLSYRSGLVSLDGIPAAAGQMEGIAKEPLDQIEERAQREIALAVESKLEYQSQLEAALDQLEALQDSFTAQGSLLEAAESQIRSSHPSKTEEPGALPSLMSSTKELWHGAVGLASAVATAQAKRSSWKRLESLSGMNGGVVALSGKVGSAREEAREEAIAAWHAMREARGQACEAWGEVEAWRDDAMERMAQGAAYLDLEYSRSSIDPVHGRSGQSRKRLQEQQVTEEPHAVTKARLEAEANAEKSLRLEAEANSARLEREVEGLRWRLKASPLTPSRDVPPQSRDGEVSPSHVRQSWGSTPHPESPPSRELHHGETEREYWSAAAARMWNSTG